MRRPEPDAACLRPRDAARPCPQDSELEIRVTLQHVLVAEVDGHADDADHDADDQGLQDDAHEAAPGVRSRATDGDEHGGPDGEGQHGQPPDHAAEEREFAIASSCVHVFTSFTE